MKKRILLVVIPTLLSFSDRELPPPAPIVFQYDAAGNRISRTSSPSNTPEGGNSVQGEETNQMDGGQENE